MSEAAFPAVMIPEVDAAGQLHAVRSSRFQMAAAVILLLVFSLGFWPCFEKPAAPMEEGALLVYPELVLRGHLPYRDFETFYGPANPSVLAAVYSVFGPGIYAERSVGLLYRVVILLAVFGLLSRRGMAFVIGATCIAGVLLLSTQLSATAWFGGVACALGSVWSLTRPDAKWRVGAGGFLAGLALCYRPDLLVAVAFAMIPFYGVMSSRARLRFMVGGIPGLAPLGVIFLLAGPGRTLDNLFTNPLLAASLGWHGSLLSAGPLVLQFGAAHLLAVSVNLVAGMLWVRRERDNLSARAFLSVALFAAAATPLVITRLEIVALTPVAFLSLGMLPVALSIFCEKKANAQARSVKVWVGAHVAVALLLAFIAPKICLGAGEAFVAAINPSMSATVFIEQGGRSFPFPSARAAQITAKMIDKLDRLSKPGDRLFVGPADLSRTTHGDTFLYHLFPSLPPATYFLEMNPSTAARFSARLASEIGSAEWAVLDMAWDEHRHPDPSLTPDADAANIVVRQQFHLVGQYGPFVLLQHNH